MLYAILGKEYLEEKNNKKTQKLSDVVKYSM
jgi:hypothetical protein